MSKLDPKSLAGMATIVILWLLAAFQAFASLTDPEVPWHWQLARAIPIVLVAIYVTGILVPWLRQIHASHDDKMPSL